MTGQTPTANGYLTYINNLLTVLEQHHVPQYGFRVRRLVYITRLLCLHILFDLYRLMPHGLILCLYRLMPHGQINSVILQHRSFTV